jgi:hypothetical protein
MSRWSLPSLADDKTAPPTQCTMHFGIPVVPELYAIKKGSWNAVGSKSGIFDIAFERKLASVCVFGTLVMSTGCANRGIETIPSNSLSSFIPTDISAILSRRSTVFPLYMAKSSMKMNCLS